MVWRNNVEIDYADREKLFEGLAIMAKIIAKEVAKEIVAQQSKAAPVLPKEKLALSCTGAAKLLGVSTTTVSKMIREGKIPANSLSRQNGYVLYESNFGCIIGLTKRISFR